MVQRIVIKSVGRLVRGEVHDYPPSVWNRLAADAGTTLDQLALTPVGALEMIDRLSDMLASPPAPAPKAGAKKETAAHA